MTLEEIKETVTMRDVMDKYKIKVSRSNMCCCPIHKEKHPSMKIYKDSFNCFSCGAHGDIFSFVQEMEKCDFKTAFMFLGGTYDKDKKSVRNALKCVEEARKQREARKERESIELIKKSDAFRLEYRNILAEICTYKKLFMEAIPNSDDFWEYLDKYHMALLKEQNMMLGGDYDF